MRPPSVGLAPQHPWAVPSFEPSRWCVMQESVPTQLSCPTVELCRLHELEAPCKNRRRTTGCRLDVAALEELSYRAFIRELVAPPVAATFPGPCDDVVFLRASRLGARLRGALGTWRVCAQSDSEDGGGCGGGGDGGRGSVVRSNAARRQGSARLGLAGARHGKARAPLVAMVATPARAATAATAATPEEGVAEVAAVEGVAGMAGAQGSDAAGRADGRVGRGEEASRVARGELCVREGWLEAAQLAALREDVRRLEASGRFAPSGVATAGRLTTYYCLLTTCYCLLTCLLTTYYCLLTTLLLLTTNY